MYISRYSLNLYTLLNGQNPYVMRQQSWMIGVLEQAERDGEQVSGRESNLLCLLLEIFYLLLCLGGPLFHTHADYLHHVCVYTTSTTLVSKRPHDDYLEANKKFSKLLCLLKLCSHSTYSIWWFGSHTKHFSSFIENVYLMARNITEMVHFISKFGTLMCNTAIFLLKCSYDYTMVFVHKLLWGSGTQMAQVSLW